MDSVVPKGCSKEQPAKGSAGLRRQASLFVKLYDKKEARLTDLLGEILEIGTRVNKWDQKSRWSLYTGLISAVVAVITGLTVPLTGAVGFAITVAVTSVAAGGAMFGFKIKQFRTEEESLKRIKQFLKIANRLEHELDELKLCLQRGPEKADHKPSLNQNLAKLFQSMDALRAADGVNELTAQCQTVFEEFDSMRKHLEEFRGAAETEEPHADLVNVSETCLGSADGPKENPESPNQPLANGKLLTDDGKSDPEKGSESSSLLQRDNGGNKSED